MQYGWVGTNLEIDLTRGNIEKREGDPKLTRSYLAGKGTNAKLFWDRVPPEVGPFSTDNLLIIGIGVLTGTIVPSANRGVITFRSPQTGLHMYSTMGGFWPTEIKHAGYDTVVVAGKSPIPVYLWINNDKVELRDASHLWGKGTHETRRSIREELKNDKVQIACIGPAGENKVYGASVECGIGASASRGGAGAIMGDKNLKAIAVLGTRDVNIAKSSELIQLCEQILGKTEPLRRSLENFAHTINQGDMDTAFYGNLSEGYLQLPPDSELRQAIEDAGTRCQDLIDRAQVREVACYNCGMRCRRVFPRADGGYTHIKCNSWWSFMVSSKTIDYDFALACFDLCEDYGLDSVSVARCIAFAVDLYEKGILTKEDTDGMHLEWRNKEVFLSLIERIARREGIGDVLANGVYEAARQLGRGAEEYAYHCKKMEYIPPATSMSTPYSALAQSVSDKADITRNESVHTQATRFVTKEGREEYIKRTIKEGFFTYPKEFEKYFMADFDCFGVDYEGGCQFVAYDEEAFTITDATGLCNFVSIFFPSPAINSRVLIADLISCVTGVDINEAELTEIARRTINLVRACNVRVGARRKDDTVSGRFFKAPLPRGPLDPDTFNKWIDRFYEIRGWNSEGIPTKQTLEKLGLDYVRQDLERRGILTD